VTAKQKVFMKHKSLLVALLVGLVCMPFASRGEDVAKLRQKAEQGDIVFVEAAAFSLIRRAKGA
jgi:hypothetical protein